jgi:prepilin-type N-terminal cleavage/methylation domain-containing protein
MNPNSRTGFTLVELLIVVGVIAVLATVVTVALNPAELLKRARDANRIQDMTTIKQTLTLYLVDQKTTNLGSATTTYVSIPDPSATSTAGTNCSSLGLPPGGNYHCAGPQYYKEVNGTGWIPVDFTKISAGSPVSALPTDPTNSASSGFYYTYVTNGKSAEVVSVPESDKYLNDPTQFPSFAGMAIADTALHGNLPTAWIIIPGNSTFGTHNFWVMKYEAKCLVNGVPATTPNDVGGDYDNYAQPCTGSYFPISTPEGYPIVDITHPDAKSYCAALGGHLLTNDEYMTIANNIANVDSNWSAGAVGNGAIYSGHNDGQPTGDLAASPDDSQGWYGETNQGGNQRRTLALSNGSIIWDLAGDVFEDVQRSTMNQGDATNTIIGPACNGTNYSGWCDYSDYSPPSGYYVTSWTLDVPQAKVAPPNPSWNASQGVGQIYMLWNSTKEYVFADRFARGGYDNEHDGAGIFALHLELYGANAFHSLGFRCVR